MNEQFNRMHEQIMNRLQHLEVILDNNERDFNAIFAVLKKLYTQIGENTDALWSCAQYLVVNPGIKDASTWFQVNIQVTLSLYESRTLLNYVGLCKLGKKFNPEDPSFLVPPNAQAYSDWSRRLKSLVATKKELEEGQAGCPIKGGSLSLPSSRRPSFEKGDFNIERSVSLASTPYASPLSTSRVPDRAHRASYSSPAPNIGRSVVHATSHRSTSAGELPQLGSPSGILQRPSVCSHCVTRGSSRRTSRARSSSPLTLPATPQANTSLVRHLMHQMNSRPSPPTAVDAVCEDNMFPIGARCSQSLPSSPLVCGRKVVISREDSAMISDLPSVDAPQQLPASRFELLMTQSVRAAKGRENFQREGAAIKNEVFRVLNV